MEELQREGIYLRQDHRAGQDRTLSEETAVHAVNQALHDALALQDSQDDLAQAARLLEHVQVAAAVAEQVAYRLHTIRAQKSSRIAQKLPCSDAKSFI